MTEDQERLFFTGDKMDTNEATVQLVKDLLVSEGGLLPYTLYKRYGVTPIMLVQIVKRLQAKSILKILPNNRLMLTEGGRKEAEGLIASIYKSSRVKMDSAYFISISGSIMDRKNPYLPSREFFEQRKKEGERIG